MKCLQCGTVVPDSAAFCPTCGSRLPGAALSPKPETFKFSCEVCGLHVSVPKAWSGRLAVCPACNQRVRIPRPDSANGPRVVPLPPPLVRPASAVPPTLFPSNGNAAAEPEKEPEPVGEEKKAAGAVPELPAELLAAGKRRNLMAGAAGIGILLCLLAVLCMTGLHLFRNAAAAQPADLELFRRIGVACTIYCVDSRGLFPVGEGAAGVKRLIDQECLDRSVLLPGGGEIAESNLKIAYVGSGLTEGRADCGRLPVAFDKPKDARGGIRVLRCDGTISVVEFPEEVRRCADFVNFLRQSTPGPEESWALILENARAIDFADGL